MAMLCEPDMERNFVIWAQSVCNWIQTVCAIGGEDFDTLVKFDLMLHSTENNGPHFHSDAAKEEKWFKVPRVRYSIWYPWWSFLHLPLRNLLKCMKVGVRQTKRTENIKVRRQGKGALQPRLCMKWFANWESEIPTKGHPTMVPQVAELEVQAW